MSEQNHFLQQYIQNGFTDSNGKLCVASFSIQDGGTITPRGAFYQRKLYSKELERQIGQYLETPMISILSKIKSQKRTYLKRREIDALKKYIIIQTYRTPYSFTNILKPFGRRLDLIPQDFKNKTGKDYSSSNVKEKRTFWNGLLQSLVNLDWGDFDSSGYEIVSFDKECFDRLFPMIVKSKREPFLTNDLGYYSEICYMQAPSDDITEWNANFNQLFRCHLSIEETVKMMIDYNPFLNYICFPISTDTSILLVDDVWRFYKEHTDFFAST